MPDGAVSKNNQHFKILLLALLRFVKVYGMDVVFSTVVIRRVQIFHISKSYYSLPLWLDLDSSW